MSAGHVPNAIQRATQKINERATNSTAKAVLIGDPPGLGKTLPAMIAIVRSKGKFGRYSIVVTPESCIEQWCQVFEQFFVPVSTIQSSHTTLLDTYQNQGTVRVLALRDLNTPPATLINYDVVILSYQFMVSDHQKAPHYLAAVAILNKTGSGTRPVRPNIALYSEIYHLQGSVKPPFIIFDESTIIKNLHSKTFAAAMALRQQCDTCVMLTGSPIDNFWHDIFTPLQFVEGHSMHSKIEFLQLVADPNPNHAGQFNEPSGVKYDMLVQIMDHFIVRRPESTISLPALHKDVVQFRLTDEEAAKLDNMYMQYRNSEGQSTITQGQGNAQRRGKSMKHLMQALQYAYHPDLVSLMKFIRFNASKDDNENNDVLHDRAEIRYWPRWLENLSTVDKWWSSRIQAVIDAFNKQRGLDPHCSVIIFDENVYFLDIVQIEFKSMYGPIDSIRFDGRTPPEERSTLLQDFKDADGAKVLLMSRAAGGVGLNVVSANVVIQCGPWWQAEWETQALKRAWNQGQLRKVTCVLLQADCAAEAYKVRVRDRKHRFNNRLVTDVTRPDGEEPKYRSDYARYV
jgi:SNF2 family DNA or RNA helicase